MKETIDTLSASYQDLNQYINGIERLKSKFDDERDNFQNVNFIFSIVNKQTFVANEILIPALCECN